MKIKTYITLWFSSDGDAPSDIISDLEKIGFEPVTGNYDMVYNWGKRPTRDDLIHLADIIKRALDGRGVLFKLETI